MKKIIMPLFIILIIVFGIYIYSKNTSSDPKNSTYTINNQKVTLVNGISEQESAPGSASKIITRYFGNEAIGDVNGNGKNDTALLLTQETGGSGTFYYVVVLLDGKVGTNGILLGDRIAPQTTEIKGGKIIVNYAEHLLSEPMTAQPSIGVSKYFIVENNVLEETEASL